MSENILSGNQWSILESLADRLIPQDEYPAAWDAGVGNFLSLLFTARGDFAETYRSGLDSLNAESIAMFGVDFKKVSDMEKDKLLISIEKGTVTSPWPIDPQSFFQLAVSQVMEGYYSDPVNGGNKDGVSWRMIGFEVTA